MRISLMHSITGLLTFVIFLHTGWYMSSSDVGNLPDAQRMIYRAGHIYFLFSGLLNLSIGVQLQFSKRQWKRVLQYFGSTLLLVSPLIFLYGFYGEAIHGQLDRQLTAIGVFLSLGGTAAHSIVFLLGMIEKKMKESH